jgi:O-antigen/teichoic acid export membrane protein
LISFISQHLSLINIINLALRALSIAGRFVLIFLITYEYSPRDLGVFGIFSTSIILAVQLVGLDFYVYTSREFIKPDSDRSTISFNQLCFHFVCYALAVPLSSMLFFSGLLPWSYFLVFTGILILDHLSNEVYRLLIVFKLSVQSSILLFIKSAAWVFFIPIGWFFFDHQFILIFYFWVMGLAISLVYGYWKLSKKTGRPRGKLNVRWIFNGIKIAIPFFVSTVLLKITEYSNRYFIDIYQGKEEVGLFTFYSSFSNILSTVVFTLVIMTQYPALLEAFTYNNDEEREWRQKKILKDSLLLSLLIAPVIIFTVWIFVGFYKEGTYAKDFLSFVVLVLSNILISINYATHYILYAQKRDSLLFGSYLAGSLLTIVLNFLLISQFSIIGAAIANFTGFLGITLLQLYFAGYGKRRT